MYVEHLQIYASLLDSNHRQQIYSRIKFKAMKNNKIQEETAENDKAFRSLELHLAPFFLARSLIAWENSKEVRNLNLEFKCFFILIQILSRR